MVPVYYSPGLLLKLAPALSCIGYGFLVDIKILYFAQFLLQDAVVYADLYLLFLWRRQTYGRTPFH